MATHFLALPPSLLLPRRLCFGTHFCTSFCPPKPGSPFKRRPRYPLGDLVQTFISRNFRVATIMHFFTPAPFSNILGFFFFFLKERAAQRGPSGRYNFSFFSFFPFFHPSFSLLLHARLTIQATTFPFPHILFHFPPPLSGEMHDDPQFPLKSYSRFRPS